ncbi:helix-turn-helix transcriptional regulator [Variovorax boronicumulans]|uniref:helix-turn-helix transcriptional regulator n=1 Tax=Variovorax boronicumulans TaxID=436515 RepID=UPI0027814BF2|nr:AraC family transcriptional regulator [Variovorax boronicumulans]MDQ0045458.1 AraC-like DNA-binding protein [Variovorax boronicumulans]
MPAPHQSSTSSSRLYGMQERANHLDFDIRFEGARDVLARPHRHEYFQIQVSIEGGEQQLIGGAVRPFRAGHLSFVLPYRVHVVPHPVGARYAIMNFDQGFLWPELAVEPLDLEEVSVARHPELAPFLFQEYVDFTFDEADFARILRWLDELSALNRARGFATAGAIRGILLQLIALACQRHEGALLEQAARHSGRSSRRDALQRVMRYVREHLSEEMSLNEAAAAAMLSPNYLAHLLKKQTDRTFTELVTERRLERAKELLLTSGVRIGDIAQQCGFSDADYFSRRFRQQIGVTPRQFRQGASAPAAAAVVTSSSP